MKSLRYILIYVSALLAVQMVVAQPEPPTVTSQLSADTIRIGDRVLLTIDVDKDVMQHVEFPTFNFKQESGAALANSSVEVINDFAQDTISRNGRREHIRKRYEMAIYDEGIYNMGKAQVLYIDKNIVDTIFAKHEDILVVKPFPLDSTAITVRDLKPQKRLKWHPAEHAGYMGIGIVVAALIVALILLLNRYLSKRGRRLVDIFKPAPPLPPHVVALGALERLHRDNLWQKNEHKLYYSALSNILRIYIDGRFDVGAMEMTTDEIAASLRDVNIEQKQKMNLLAVLRSADLVKFAKAMPEADENELAFERAYDFVNSTKPIEKVEEVVEDEPTKNKREGDDE